MSFLIIIIALNMLFIGWVLWMAARDPANIFKRRGRTSDRDGGSTPETGSTDRADSDGDGSDGGGDGGGGGD